MDLKLEDSLGFIINRTNTKIKHELYRGFRCYGVTPEQGAVLNCLWEHEGISPKALADTIVKDKPNTNRILEKLQKKGLVVRRLDPANERSFRLYLTEEGRNLRNKLIVIVEQVLDRATRGMERQKIEELKSLLNFMYTNLR